MKDQLLNSENQFGSVSLKSSVISIINSFICGFALVVGYDYD